MRRSPELQYESGRPALGSSRPIRALFGTGDVARPSFVAADTANADDYTLETVDASHFIIDERPDLVRAKLVALAEETQR